MAVGIAALTVHIYFPEDLVQTPAQAGYMLIVYVGNATLYGTDLFIRQLLQALRILPQIFGSQKTGERKAQHISFFILPVKIHFAAFLPFFFQLFFAVIDPDVMPVLR